MDTIPLNFPIRDLELRKEYSQLIPPFFHCCLDGQDPFEIKSELLGFSIHDGNHPVGVIFASFYDKIQTARIHMLAIKNSPAYEEELASRLLQELSRHLIQRGAVLATFSFTREESFSPILEKILLANNWKGPKPLIIKCLFKRVDFDPHWWNQEIKLAEGFEEFLLKDLTLKERKDLTHRYEQMSLPDYVYPFGREEKLIELKNSLGLRYNGKIIGWMVTHRISHDIIRYSALYLEEEFASTRYWLKLLIDALHIHKKMVDVPYGLLEINLEQISKQWLKFIERKLFPHACKITHTELFWKKFSSHT